MILKAITHCYTQEGINGLYETNKVIGIFYSDIELEKALDDIREFYRQELIEPTKDEYDDSCGNWFLSFPDKDKSYFYTSDYILNELIF